MKPSLTRAALRATLLAAMIACTQAVAQAPAPAAPKAADAKPADAKPADAKPVDAGALAPLAWLEGCWRGNVTQYEFREHWMPPRGNLMVGVSQTVTGGATQGYEYLRLEPRADGVYYVAVPGGKTETAFRLVEQTVDRANDRNDEIFVFANAASEFPQKITYRRASGGWLYATVEGKASGVERKVVYPMRRIDCESGEFVLR